MRGLGSGALGGLGLRRKVCVRYDPKPFVLPQTLRLDAGRHRACRREAGPPGGRAARPPGGRVTPWPPGRPGRSGMPGSAWLPCCAARRTPSRSGLGCRPVPPDPVDLAAGKVSFPARASEHRMEPHGPQAPVPVTAAGVVGTRNLGTPAGIERKVRSAGRRAGMGRESETGMDLRADAGLDREADAGLDREADGRTDPGADTRMEPEAAAGALIGERFPAARAAFLGGGVLSARRTPTSDLDIAMLVDDPAAPYRESVRWRDWPVELFVQRTDTIGAWFAKDTAKRRPSLARMCGQGVILADADGTGAAIRERALAVLDAGPPPITPAELDRRRYGLTDLLDDLAGSSDPGETAVICWNVLCETAELALLLARGWLGSGKWLLRELRAADSRLADELIAAREDPGGLAVLADGVLARAGGRLWAGYRQAGRP